MASNELISQINQAIERRNGCISLIDLKNEVSRDTSLQVFIRSHPELYFVYTDTTSNIKWVHKSQYKMQMPVFSKLPHDLGKMSESWDYLASISNCDFKSNTFKLPVDIRNGSIDHKRFRDITSTQQQNFRSRNVVSLPDFNFAEYADIDDTRPIEIDFEIPKMSFNICIKSASNISFCGEEFPNILCYVKFNGELIGSTSAVTRTLNPEWNDAFFYILVPPNENIFTSKLEFELCDVTVSTAGTYEKQSVIGKVELVEYGLTELLQGFINVSRVYDIFDSNKGSSVVGSLTICGGKSGFEISILSASNLPVLQDERCKIIATLRWNNNEIGNTSAVQSIRQNPIWNQTWSLPTDYMNEISEEFKQRMQDSTIEIQIWSTHPEHMDRKDECLGCAILKGETLLNCLVKDFPYAITITKSLQKANALVRKRSHVQGDINIMIGASGLHIRRYQPYEMSIVEAQGISKFHSLFFVVVWNNKQIHRSQNIPLVHEGDFAHAKCDFHANLVMENRLSDDDDGVIDKREPIDKCTLKIEFFESITKRNIQQIRPDEDSRQSEEEYGEYLGQVVIAGQELQNLVASKFASMHSYSLERNNSIEFKRQSLVRGKLKMRGGLQGLRGNSERIFIITSCFDIPDGVIESHFPNTDTHQFYVYTSVALNGNFVGRTSPVLFNHKSVLFDVDNVMYIDLPQVETANGVEPFYDKCMMEIEVYFTNSKSLLSAHDEGVCFATCQLDKIILHEILESDVPNEMCLTLKSKSKNFKFSSTAPQIKVSSCGLNFPSVYSFRAHQSDLFNKLIREKQDKEVKDNIPTENTVEVVESIEEMVDDSNLKSTLKDKSNGKYLEAISDDDEDVPNDDFDNNFIEEYDKNDNDSVSEDEDTV